MTITKSTASLHKTKTSRLFLSRGIVVIAWAAVFAAVAGPLTSGVAALLVLYPLIDVVGSLVDARGQDGSDRRLLLANAAPSVVACGALGIAATGSTASVFAAFGVWAVLNGTAQRVIALRRRAQLGSHWPMLLAGVGSVGFGYGERP